MRERQIFIGDVLFVVCCAFYLAWWVLAFRPVGAAGGIGSSPAGELQTGWLLIPASFAGLWGVILIIWGVAMRKREVRLIPGLYILLGGVAAYFILLAVTALLFKRPATSELILITGFCMLMLAEVNALYGSGVFSRDTSVGLFILIGAVTVISLICYVLYFPLNGRSALAGYVDGMIPLLLAGLTTAGLAVAIAVRGTGG